MCGNGKRVHTHTHNLFSSYNAICVRVFKAHHLALDNQLVCYPMGKTTSLFLAFLSHL